MGIIYSSNHKTNIAVGNDENDYVIIMNKNENNYDVSIEDIPIVDSNCPCDVSVEDTINESKPIPNNFPCEVSVKDTIDEINFPCEVSIKDTIDCPKPVPPIDEINFVINPLNNIKKKKKKRKNKNK